MPVLELVLSEDTFNLVRQIATSHKISTEQWVGELVEAHAREQDDPIQGMFADAPDVMDQITDEAFAARESHSLRQQDHD